MARLEGLSLPVVMLAVFASAKVLSEICERVGLPGLAGEILAGVLLGPSVLGWIHPNAILQDLSELGVIFLLFRVGLECKASELMKVGGTAFVVAASGVVLPLAMGWALMRAWGSGHVESLFVGAALVATSVGITAQVLSARNWLHEISSQIILGAAVIDDVLGLIVLAVVSGVTKGRVQAFDLMLTSVLPVLFLILLARYGHKTVGRAVPAIETRLRASEAQFHLAMILLFGLSVLALWTGVAAIVGAFLAGISLGEAAGDRVHTLAHGTAELLVPFFLAGIGLKVDLGVFRDSGTLLLAALVFGVAVISKLAGCGLGAIRLGTAQALRVGFGMVPRGEVGMVAAQLSLGMGAVSNSVYSVVVFTALATTVVAPPLLALSYREPAHAPQGGPHGGQ